MSKKVKQRVRGFQENSFLDEEDMDFSSLFQENPKQERVFQDPDWFALRKMEGHVVETILEKMKQLFGQKMFDFAWSDFSFNGKYELDRKVYEEPLFTLWFLHNWIINPVLLQSHLTNHITIEENHHLTPALFCANILNLFSPNEEKLIEAIGRSHFSFLLVLDVTLGESILAKDILTQKEVRIKEAMGSYQIKKGMIMFNRVVHFNGQSVSVGTAPYIIPNSYFNYIVNLRENLEEEENCKQLTNEILLDYEYVLREGFFVMMEKAAQPQKFVNNDGDPLLFHEIHYKLNCSIKEAFDCLASLNKTDSAKVLWSQREVDNKGKTTKVQFSWDRKNGKNNNIGFDISIFADITIWEDKIKLFVNSAKRAGKAKAEITKRLKAEAVFDRQEINTPGELAKRSDKCEKKEEFPVTDEMKEELQKMMDNHWKKWLDTSLDFLDGLSPRKAVRSKKGREKLEALLLHFEEQNEQTEEHLKANVEWIKKELGL